VRKFLPVLVVLLGGIVSAALADAPALSPALSDLDRLRIEVAALKQELHQIRTERSRCEVELAPLRYQRDEAGVQEVLRTLQTTIDAAHPGYHFNPLTGGLDPIPTPSVPGPASDPGETKRPPPTPP
jgi:hypothetical protein